MGRLESVPLNMNQVKVGIVAADVVGRLVEIVGSTIGQGSKRFNFDPLE